MAPCSGCPKRRFSLMICTIRDKTRATLETRAQPAGFPEVRSATGGAYTEMAANEIQSLHHREIKSEACRLQAESCPGCRAEETLHIRPELWRRVDLKLLAVHYDDS